MAARVTNINTSQVAGVPVLALISDTRAVSVKLTAAQAREIAEQLLLLADYAENPYSRAPATHNMDL